jgi:DNA (cytosine-5)-methyltransferase 1
MSITVTDQFCGAGGSSLGAEGTGLYSIELAMNHWPKAIETHGNNFPDARHACVDVACVDPSWYPTTDVLLTSPECKAHSYAKGRPKNDPSLFDPRGDMAAERSRATMWDVPRFAEYHDYKMIVVENVVQALDWGPKHNPGSQFMAWLQAMVGLGYEYRINCLNSSFFPPTPQSRDRLYVVFWKRGIRAPELDFTPPAWCPSCERVVYAVQRWKQAKSKPAVARLERLGVPTGVYGVQYVYACPTCGAKAAPAITPAAHAIDWTLPSTRIGDRPKPLKPATMERIRKGLEKLANRRAAIVPLDHLTRDGKVELKRLRDVELEPYPTQTGQQEQGLVVAVGGNTYERAGYARAWPTSEPQPTVTCTADRGLVVPAGGPERQARSLEEPIPTMLTRETHAVVLSNMHNNTPRIAGEEPTHAVTTGGRLALVVAGRENGVPRDAHGEPMQTATTITSLYLLEGDAAIVPLRRNTTPRDPSAEPISTICASGGHHALLTRHNGPGPAGHSRDVETEPAGTVTTQPGMSLTDVPDSSVLAYNSTSTGRDTKTEPLPATTTVDPYALVEREAAVDDCTFRMLEPHEIGAAMAFPGAYRVVGNKRDRVKQYGNAVTPPVMQALLQRCATALDE